MRNVLYAAALCAVLASSCVSDRMPGGNEVLHYVSPSRYMEEALMIGNGCLGAAVYGGVSVDSLSLNDLTLWTGEPNVEVYSPEAYKAVPEIRAALDRGDFALADQLQRRIQGAYSQNYQPLGRLYIRNLNISDSEYEDYSRRLDLSKAVASTSFSAGGNEFSRSYYASAADSVIVSEISVKGDAELDMELSLDCPLMAEITADGNELKMSGYAAYYSRPVYSGGEGSHLYDENRGIHFTSIVSVKAPDSDISADGKVLRIKGGKKAWIYFTNVTSFNGYDRDPVKDGKAHSVLARARIDKVQASAPEKILRRHIEDYRSFYTRVKLDLGTTAADIAALPTDIQLKQYGDLHQYNPDLEELYFNFGRYLLISCSRTPAVPANLQGLWNEYICPPWSSNYTTNINLEENYWLAESCNLSELHKPLLDFIVNLSRTGKDAARYYYGVERGWCLGQNSDIWALTPPVGEHEGHPMWANWTMGGAWLSSHIWEHYLFTGDIEFLKEYYPALRGAAEFCLDWLVERDGVLVTSPGTSPENTFITPDGIQIASSIGNTADMAMVRQCLTDTFEAAELLGDEQMQSEISEVLPRLRPYRIGERGNLLEWAEDYKESEPTHRHQSHLYGVFPGRHITFSENPELIAAAHKTLELRGKESTGWSTGWRVNLYARMHDAAEAYATYRKLLQYVSPDGYRGEDARRGGGTYPNLLDAHSPFQIDGNFGGASGVAEMLLQSSGNALDILPARPEQWEKGSACGLKARGAYEVDIEWDECHVKAKIRAIKGGSLTVRYKEQKRQMEFAPSACKTVVFDI